MHWFFRLLCVEIVLLTVKCQLVGGVVDGRCNKQIAIGKKHVINTTACTWNWNTGNCTGEKKWHQFHDQRLGETSYNYTICYFTFEEVKIHDTVKLSGRNGLVIKSNGKIIVKASLTVEGLPDATDKYSDMWLGGYCTRHGDGNLSPGRGPGGGKGSGASGAGHGGWGIRPDNVCGNLYGWYYGFNTSHVDLIGGSSGGVFKRSNGISCGGGVIKIVSDSNITIDSQGTISTNARSNNSSDSCIGGGSGGTIILAGPKVTVDGTLESKGDIGLSNNCAAPCGSGGVIMITETVAGSKHNIDSYNNTRGIGNMLCSSGAVIINGERKSKYPPAKNGSGYIGCYRSNLTFTSILPDYKVKPTNCIPKCTNYSLLHEFTCACLGKLNNSFTKVGESNCEMRCKVSDTYICGGKNSTHNFYSLYNGTKNSSEVSSVKPTQVGWTATTDMMGETTICSTSRVTNSLITTTAAKKKTTKSFPKATISSTPHSTNSISTTPAKGKPDEKNIAEMREYLSTVEVTSNNSDKVIEVLSHFTQAIDDLNPQDLNLSLSIMEAVINNGGLSAKNSSQSTRLQKNVLTIGDKLLGAVRSWIVLEKERSMSPVIVIKYIEEIVKLTGSYMEMNDTVLLNSTNIGLYKEATDPDHFEGHSYSFSGVEITKGSPGEVEEQENVFIPVSLGKYVKGSSPFRLNFLKFQQISPLAKPVFSGERMEQYSLASSIISVFVNQPLITELKERVNLSFPALPKDTNNSYKELTCSFLDFSTSDRGPWSTTGVKTSIDANGRVVCSTNHFTSFAVLIIIDNTRIHPKHAAVLHWMTYVGCGVSLVCLVLTLVTFMFLKLLTKDHTMVHTNLALALLFAQILFLLGIHATDKVVLCKVIAIVLHYFYTAAICWMGIEGIHLFRKVVQVFISPNDKKYYYVLGWGTPVVIVSISALCQFDGYGSDKACYTNVAMTISITLWVLCGYVISCWLSVDSGLIWAFVLPVVVVVLANLIILLMVIRVMVVAVKSRPPQSEATNIRAGVKGIVFLLPILGLTWLFGILAVNSASLFFQYTFTFLNSLQGFFIFLFHCVLNAEVRAALHRQQEKSSLQRSVNDSTSKNKGGNLSKKTSNLKRVLKIKVAPYVSDQPPTGQGDTKETTLN